jgi:prolyl 4-hydroxylase
MDGCRKQYGTKGNRCDSVEEERLLMSVRQPQSMVNYTSAGFKKIKAPTEVMDLLTRHWEKNKGFKKAEVWTAGNVYVNHWESPTYMVVSTPFLPRKTLPRLVCLSFK